MTDALEMDWLVQTTNSNERLGFALGIIRKAEYWRELGFESWEAYVQRRKGLDPHVAAGLVAAARISAWSETFREMVEAGCFDVARLAKCDDLITPDTLDSWVSMLMAIANDQEFSAVVSQYRQHMRSGRRGNQVFVPLYIPLDWFKRNWGPAAGEADSHFDVLLSLLRKARNDAHHHSHPLHDGAAPGVDSYREPDAPDSRRR